MLLMIFLIKLLHFHNNTHVLLLVFDCRTGLFFNVVILAFLPKQRMIVILALQQCVLLLVYYVLYITGTM